jgi:hypothetical protein
MFRLRLHLGGVAAMQEGNAARAALMQGHGKCRETDIFIESGSE